MLALYSVTNAELNGGSGVFADSRRGADDWDVRALACLAISTLCAAIAREMCAGIPCFALGPSLALGRK